MTGFKGTIERLADSGAAIGGNVTGGTEGSVLFVGPGATLAQDNANLFWNDSTNTLALGGDLTVGDDITVTDDATIGGDVAITGTITVGTVPATAGTITTNGSGDVVVTPGTGGTTAIVNGNISAGRGGSSAATAYLHLGAGTATAGTAPIKLTAGSNTSSAVAGQIEFDGTNLFYTDSTPTRRTVANLLGTQTFQNKTLDNTNTASLKDTLFTLQDDGDPTKLLAFQLSGITTGTTRTLTVPNASTTIVGTDATQTLTNKDLTSPTINGSAIGYNLSAYAAGTVYSLTNTQAAVDFGTTDPAITIDKAGTYLIMGSAQLEYNGTTYAANQTATLKFRRTNNTAADLTNATRTVELEIVTTLTGNAGAVVIPPTIYTTANTNDAIAMFGAVSAAPGAGTVDVMSAEIVAIRLY